MAQKKIDDFHEIIIGLVAGVGADNKKIINTLKNKISSIKYQVKVIKVTALLENLSKKYNPIQTDDEVSRIEDRITKCNSFRDAVKRKDAMAILSIAEIKRLRSKSKKNHVIYIISQFKKATEINLLRKIYGKNFILVSVYDHEENRKKRLHSYHSKNKKLIDGLIKKDEKQDDQYGQSMLDAFVEADYFFTMNKLNQNIERFIKILLGYPYHTPTKDELNMSLAWNLSLRSADLSRQVGAAIANPQGEIIAAGCNDVPKNGGGMFWEGEKPDYRDFQLGYDSNSKFKNAIIEELIDITKKKLQSKMDTKKIYKHLVDEKADIFNILEYHRAVHAEESAICDAARRGIRLKGATLYCTTFPCHLCAKHIIAVGIKRVVYIHPYPKNRVKELYEDMAAINPHDEHHNKVVFEPFIGVSPRRMLKVFHLYPQKIRKRDGKTIDWKGRYAVSPFLKKRTPLAYYDKEVAVLQQLLKQSKKIIKNDLKKVFDKAVTEFNAWPSHKKLWGSIESILDGDKKHSKLKKSSKSKKSS